MIGKPEWFPTQEVRRRGTQPANVAALVVGILAKGVSNLVLERRAL